MARGTKRKGRAGKILFFVVCICALFIVLIQVKQANRYRNVLLQIQKSFPVTRTQEGYLIRLTKESRLDEALSRLEGIVSRNSGRIADYEVGHLPGSVRIRFRIEDAGGLLPGFTLLVVEDKDGASRQAARGLPEGVKALVCLIMDDAGYANPLTEEFIRLPVRMGIAVLPFLEKSAETAEKAHRSGKEVLLHLPMEPRNFRARKIRLFPQEILVGMSEESIRHNVGRMLKELKYARGVNNHQGSRATEDDGTMTALLQILKEKELFFVDSLTSPQSVTEKTARKLGTAYAPRDVFLDNADDYAYIKGQMEKLIRVALRKKKAVGIGHVSHGNTLKVLKDFIPVFQKEGIRLVNPSRIVDKLRDKEVTYDVKENRLYSH